jgi:hypothetical protein
MRQILSRRYAVTWTTGASAYVYSEQVPPGYVVHVKSCVGYSAERDASDDVVLGYTDGGEKIIVTAMATLAAQMGVASPQDFYVGEGDKVFAYFPDVENNDTIELHINGTLLPIEDFEKGME